MIQKTENFHNIMYINRQAQTAREKIRGRFIFSVALKRIFAR